MKTNAPYLRTSSALFVLVAILFAMVLNTEPVHAASRTWVGEGADDFWSTPANWDIGAPVAGDGILFGGNVRLSPFNDYPAGTAFNFIAFNNPSGPFVLGGNGINPGSGIVNNMTLAPQTINMPLMWGGNSGAFVVDDGLLTIAGPISGAGFHKNGLGQLILSASNSFGGPLTSRKVRSVWLLTRISAPHQGRPHRAGLPSAAAPCCAPRLASRSMQTVASMSPRARSS